jgi:Pex19 protein family
MMAEDEDDLDKYLDGLKKAYLDVLEEFDDHPVKPLQPKPAMDDDAFKTVGDEEFMKLLQENMSKMLGGDSETVPQNPANNGNFQDTISQTLNKLKTSSSQAQVIYSITKRQKLKKVAEMIQWNQ